MANLNQHDIIFLDSSEFKGLKEVIELKYDFKIISVLLPDVISFTSKKLILNTTRGIFFLKEKPLYCSSDLALRRSAHFQEYASHQLDIVPKIFMTLDHDYYVVWNQRRYFLTDYKKGRHYNGSLNDLGVMSDALRTFQACGTSYLEKFKELRTHELFCFESPSIAAGISDVEKSAKTQEDRNLSQEIILIYKNLCSEYSIFPKGRYIMAHSDFTLFNLVFEGSKISAINDFDNVKVLPRVHDMAEFLVSASLLNYIAPLTNLKLPLLTKPDMVAFEYLLLQYKLKFDLTKDEIMMLGTLVEIVWLWTLVLSVFKEDYTLSDLEPAIDSLRQRKTRTLIEDIAM
jgi:hypothetical protein